MLTDNQHLLFTRIKYRYFFHKASNVVTYALIVSSLCTLLSRKGNNIIILAKRKKSMREKLHILQAFNHDAKNIAYSYYS